MKRNILFVLLILLSFAARGSAVDLGKVDIHGFLSQGYMKSNSYDYYVGMEEGTFQFNEFGINFSSKISKQLRIGLQLFSRDIGNIGNGEVVVDWAIADYYFAKCFGMRAGKLKVPMGLYNETRDVDVVRTGIFLNQSVYFDILRDSMLSLNGIGIYGEARFGCIGSINYQALFGASNITNDSGVAQGIVGLSSIDEVVELDYKWASAVGLKWLLPIPGLVVGFSDARGQIDITGWSGPLLIHMKYDPFEILVYSLEYSYKNLVFVTEYSRMNIYYIATAEKVDLGCLGDIEKLMGWYSSASYRFCRWLEGAVAYSEFYDNAENMEGHGLSKDYKAWQKDVTLSLRFDINENWILKVEDHIIDGNSQVLSQNVDEYTVRRWNMWAVKVSFTF